LIANSKERIVQRHNVVPYCLFIMVTLIGYGKLLLVSKLEIVPTIIRRVIAVLFVCSKVKIDPFRSISTFLDHSYLNIRRKRLKVFDELCNSRHCGYIMLGAVVVIGNLIVCT
jgi:hypothetical protein